MWGSKKIRNQYCKKPPKKRTTKKVFPKEDKGRKRSIWIPIRDHIDDGPPKGDTKSRTYLWHISYLRLERSRYLIWEVKMSSPISTSFIDTYVFVIEQNKFVNFTNTYDYIFTCFKFNDSCFKLSSHVFFALPYGHLKFGDTFSFGSAPMLRHFLSRISDTFGFDIKGFGFFVVKL